MTKVALAAVIASICLLSVSSASATVVQQVIGHSYSTSTTGPGKGKNYVRLDTYLSTRDAASTRGPTLKASPVGKVFMDFPSGGTINKTAASTCNLSEYTLPSVLAKSCSRSVIGTGWALLNTGEATAREQLSGSPENCPAGGSEQYLRTYETNSSVGPTCVPFGSVWVKITAYQGAILKNQWWCYGDAGAPKAGAACNNRQDGADAKGKLFNKFNDLTNGSKLNGCNIIFANDNSLAPLAFGGSVNQCKNRLTTLIPALNGFGSGLGELTGGYVLSDFFLRITSTKYLKAPACPANKTWTVKTKVVFSSLKGETGAAPASSAITSPDACVR